MIMGKYLRVPEASQFLIERFGFGAVRSLNKWRSTGGGPPYRKFGRMVLYDPDDLIAWVDARTTIPAEFAKS